LAAGRSVHTAVAGRWGWACRLARLHVSRPSRDNAWGRGGAPASACCCGVAHDSGSETQCPPPHPPPTPQSPPPVISAWLVPILTLWQVWLGGMVLGEVLCASPALVAGRVCVELGAGTGLVGIAAHRLGAAAVCVTDGAAGVVAACAANVGAEAARRVALVGGAAAAAPAVAPLGATTLDWAAPAEALDDVRAWWVPFATLWSCCITIAPCNRGSSLLAPCCRHPAFRWRWK
jgi:hypothetical protein